jgi:hypothetical protein
MPFDPDNTKDLKRLRLSMSDSRKRLGPFREFRLDVLRQYVGRHYSDEGAGAPVPVNLIEIALNIYLRRMAARNPKVITRTWKEGLRPNAVSLGMDLNNLIKEIRLVDTIRMFALEALCSLGIVKVGEKSAGTVEIEGFRHDVGQPFADYVSLDDWVHDMRAERYEEVAYAGNRYYLPLEYVRDSELYRKTEREELKASGSKYEDTDGFQDDERAAELSQGTDGGGDDFYDYVTLWDIWLPLQNLVVTLTGDEPTKVLRVVEWEGPEGGPFHLLGFSKVPNNIMPLSPMAAGMDIHLIVNQLYHKLGRQAERQKDITTYQGADVKDATRLKGSADGEYLRVDNPKNVNTHSFGGVNSNNLAFAMHMAKRFKTDLGNLDLLGGLGPQSETLGQDRMMAYTASVRVDDMQDQVVDATTGIIKSLAWYAWYSPLRSSTVVNRIPGIRHEFVSQFTPEQREGDILDYDISIEPYSMQPRSPSERVQRLLFYFERLVAPYMQLYAAQGKQWDMEKFMGILAKLDDMTELDEMFRFVEPQEMQPGGNGERPLQSPNTSRTYNRVNRGGATDPEEAMIQSLLSGGDNQMGGRTLQAAGM